MPAGSTCWGQFVAMLFCHLGRAQSLREILRRPGRQRRTRSAGCIEGGEPVVVGEAAIKDHDGADGVYFVTRLKDNADYGVVERRPVPARGLFLRRIAVWDEAQQRTLVFLTNQRRLAASTIAAIYRQRWQIELFFKALKQNLRSKTSSAPAPTPCRFRSGPP